MRTALALFFFWLLSAAPVLGQLTGRVTGESGEPLPFASVYVAQTTIGVTTNADGYYKLPLESGTHRVVFRYLGYRQLERTLDILPGGTTLNVSLEPELLELGEVVISTEDPAYRIMREVIARREKHKKAVDRYVCDVYIKGFHKLLDAPEKILGREIGNMGGILDSNRTGVLYLSESVSRLYVQQQPERTKEIMISSRVSGNDNGFSLNRATLTEFNLYEEKINIERELLSPLADNAFAFYQFTLLGKREENGLGVYKIAVRPKRKTDPVFEGVIYIVDEQYTLYGSDLFIQGHAIKQPVLDTLRFVQEYTPLPGQQKWVLLSQLTTFDFRVLGFGIHGTFNSVFSNYNEDFPTEQVFSNKEVFRIENTASDRDSAYWERVRPVPLTEEERRDYSVKDSLRQIWDSEAYKDSMDRKNNRFRPFDLVDGYTWRNSFKRQQFEWPGLFRWVQFNTVQGLVFNMEPSFQKNWARPDFRQFNLDGQLNYGFSEQKLRGGLRIRHRFENIHRTTLMVAAGVKPVQFDDANPISPFLNSLYSLALKRNYMKLYERAFGEVEFRRNITPGWHQTLRLTLEERRPLNNTTDYSWYEQPDRQYTLNGPVYAGAPFEPFFTKNRAFLIEWHARIRFGVEYSTYPGRRVMEDSPWPSLRLHIRHGVPLADDMPDYLFGKMGLEMSDWSWGLAGYSEWSLSGGGFFYKNKLTFIDAYHPLANQTIFAASQHLRNGFLLMPYYQNSTDGFFAELHWQHHFQGWILDKLPGLRKLNWKEVLHVNAFHSDQKAIETGENAAYRTYWEVGFGFENIGVRAFRPLSIIVANRFEDNKHQQTGVVLHLAF